jgi:hypothetical protein
VGEPEPEAGGLGDKKRTLLCSTVSELYRLVGGFNVSNLGIKGRMIATGKGFFTFCKMFENAQFFRICI